MNETGERERDVRLAKLLGLPVKWSTPPYLNMPGYDPGARYPWLKGEEPDGCNYDWAPVTAYGTSLDAMHAVEAELARRGLADAYACALAKGLPLNQCWTENLFTVATAPASVRREAAIRVLEGENGDE